MKIEDHDLVALLACEQNRDRLDKVLDELSRVGLMNHRWFIVSCAGHSGQENAASVFKQALMLGMKRVLVLEDDIRFLKDAAMARRIIESAPSTCDTVYYDVFPQWGDELLKHVLRRRDSGVAFMQMLPMTYGTSCWSVNRKGMEEFLRLHAGNPDEPCDSAVFTMNPNLENCFSLNPPCVQVLFSNANNLRWGMAQHNFYRPWIGSYERFNVEKGYDFGDILYVGEPK
jgi:hypothetical protein